MASEICPNTNVLPVQEYIPIPSAPLTSNSYMTKLFSITDDLCMFMNIPINTKVSVKNAVEYVLDYIKKNGLSSPNDRTKIKVDSNLSALFNIQNEEIVISYFDIHEHVYFHFIDK